MNVKKVYRVLFYVSGMIILAAGITLNTKTNLGVSPIISVSFTFSRLLDVNFGDATFVWYSVFVLIEIILHAAKKKKKQIPLDLLQIIVSLAFTRFMNLFSAVIPELDTQMTGTVWCTMPGRLLALAFAIVLTGIGAALSLNARIVPNPGDGIVQAVSDTIGKSVGFTKNCVDISCVCTSVLSGMLLGGRLYGIGIGTICAMIGVGRVIAVFNHFTLQSVRRLSGLTE